MSSIEIWEFTRSYTVKEKIALTLHAAPNCQTFFHEGALRNYGCNAGDLTSFNLCRQPQPLTSCRQRHIMSRVHGFIAFSLFSGLTFLLPLLQRWFLNIEWSLTLMSHRGLKNELSLALTTTYCNKLLWPRLEAAKTYEDKHKYLEGNWKTLLFRKTKSIVFPSRPVTSLAMGFKLITFFSLLILKY